MPDHGLCAHAHHEGDYRLCSCCRVLVADCAAWLYIHAAAPGRETFGSLKHHLRQKYVGACMETTLPKLPKEAWLRVLFSVSEFMTASSWRRSFEVCGIAGSRNKLSKPLAALTNFTAAEDVSLYSSLLEADWGGLYPTSVAENVAALLRPVIPTPD